MYKRIPLPGERPYHPVIVKSWKLWHTPTKLRLSRPTCPTLEEPTKSKPSISPTLLAIAAGVGLLVWLLRD